jgi:hypothetical protein
LFSSRTVAKIFNCSARLCRQLRLRTKGGSGESLYMRTFNHELRLELARGQLWSHDLRGKTRLSCESGILWLTRNGDARDYLLRAGESIELCGDTHVVAQALRNATARIEQSRAKSYPTSWRQRLRSMWPSKAPLSTHRC